MSRLSEFFKERGCYWDEYAKQFGSMYFKDETVTVVGGDCGSTCVYVILLGAKKCIMFEKDPGLRRKAQEVAALLDMKEKIEVRGEWDGMTYPDTTVFLMDCEGCEEHVDVDLITDKYNKVGIAIHEWTKNRAELLQRIVDRGYRLTYVTPDGRKLYFTHEW